MRAYGRAPKRPLASGPFVPSQRSPNHLAQRIAEWRNARKRARREARREIAVWAEDNTAAAFCPCEFCAGLGRLDPDT